MAACHHTIRSASARRPATSYTPRTTTSSAASSESSASTSAASLLRTTSSLPIGRSSLNTDHIVKRTVSLSSLILAALDLMSACGSLMCPLCRCQSAAPVARLQRPHDRVRPAGDPELGVDRGDRVAHRLVGDVELAGDVVVGAAGGDHPEHGALTFGEVGERLVLDLAGGATRQQRRHLLGHRRPEDHPAAGGGTDRVVHLLGTRALEQVAARTGADRAEDGVVVLVHGEHQDPQPRVAADEEPGRLDAVELRHLDVHHDDIRLRLPDHVQRLAAVGGRADDLDAVERAEQCGEAVADDLVVVDDDDTDRAGRGGHAVLLSGSRALTTVPPPSGQVMSARPPSSAARSRTLTRPTPA